MPKTNLSHYTGQTAKERSEVLTIESIIWTSRWGFVSDKSLCARLKVTSGANRPQYAYQLWKRGLLDRIEVPYAKRHAVEDGCYVYRLSKMGASWLNELIPGCWLHIPMAQTFRPGWSIMQHMLDVQKIAAGLIDKANSETWSSEPETRALYKNKTITPDLVFNRGNGTEHWIEYDRTEKRGIKLDHWVNRYALMFLNVNQKIASGVFDDNEVRSVTIITSSEKVASRYRSKFDLETIRQTHRNRTTGNIFRLNDHWTNVKTEIMDRISVIGLPVDNNDLIHHTES